MTPVSLLFWTRLLQTLALESALVVALVLLLERFVRSAFWHRTAWQIAMVLLLGLTASELSGFGRGASVCLLAQPEPKRADEPLLPKATKQTVTIETSPGSIQSRVEAVSPVSRVWWPGLVWAVGVGVVLLRVAFAQSLLLALRVRRRKVADTALTERAAALARQLGIRRRVQPVEAPGLKSPVAFGLLRLGVGLPSGFARKFDPSQQDAMLAHELAHLAGRDPLWYLLADVASACLWWQPLVWWARRRLHSSSELLADEATALVEEGPLKLAECLVTFGRELTGARRWAWIGVEGGNFRSSLGQRVERLLRLRGERRLPCQSWQSVFLKSTIGVFVVGIVIIGSGWVQARGLSKQETWQQNLAQSWTASAGATLMLAAAEKEPVPSTVSTRTARNEPASQSASLYARTFNVRTAVIRQNLQNSELLPNDSSLTNLHLRLQAVFKKAGVDLSAPKTVFVNEYKNSIYIRASLKDLEVISGIIEVLRVESPHWACIGDLSNSKTEELRTMLFKLELPTVERNLRSLQPPLLGPTETNLFVLSRALFAKAGLDMSAPRAAFLNDFGLLCVRAAPKDLNAIECAVEELNATPRQTSKALNTSAPQQLTIETEFVECPATGENQLDRLLEGTGVALTTRAHFTNLLYIGKMTTNAVATQVACVLNETEREGLLRKLKTGAGFSRAPSPMATTVSGRETRVSMQDPVALPQSFGIQEPMPIGSVLEVVPTVRADGCVIELLAQPYLSELLTNQGNPTLCARILNADICHVRDGQTFLLGGLITKGETRIKNLYVFITPVLIDAKGNRLHPVNASGN